jgi:hypothetical protein
MSKITSNLSQFDKDENYSIEHAKKDFGNVLNLVGENRLTLTGEQKDRSIKVAYPEGKIGSQDSGGSFRVKIDGGTEYTLEYKLKFDNNFEWVQGGKLPGLCGGACYTGGDKPKGDGFSARYMWRIDGELVIYLYHVDQEDIYGDDLSTNFFATKDEWITLKQRIQLNTEDHKNGIIQVWVNGEQKLYKDNIRFMTDSSKTIDLFYFSTFFGGNTPDWAPSQSVYTYFKDFTIQKIK